MPDTKLRPTSTMKSNDKSSEQIFGHVNVTNRNLYLNIITLRAKLSGAVYCNRSCLFVCLFVCGFVGE